MNSSDSEKASRWSSEIAASMAAAPSEISETSSFAALSITPSASSRGSSSPFSTESFDVGEAWERRLITLCNSIVPLCSSIIDKDFRAEQVGLFDPRLDPMDKKPLASLVGCTTIYHDVFLFTRHLKAKSELYDVPASRLDECLRGKAEAWWTNEISQSTRKELSDNTNLSLWIKLLQNRFELAPSAVVYRLTALYNDVCNIGHGKDAVEFLHRAFDLWQNEQPKDGFLVDFDKVQAAASYRDLGYVMRQFLLPRGCFKSFGEKIIGVKPFWEEIYRQRQQDGKHEAFW